VRPSRKTGIEVAKSGLVLVLLLGCLVGCAAKKRPAPKAVTVFKSCAPNGGRMVCECDPHTIHRELNARTGEYINVCE